MGRHHGWPSHEKPESMNISLLSTYPRNCEICGYEAESLYDFDAHTWDVHDESIEFNFCESTFENESDLMKHKKKEHFIDPTMQQENKSDQSTSPSCQFCDNKFTLVRELMKHKKIQKRKR